MQPSQSPDESPDVVPADIRARVMPAVLDELTRWGVERFSVEALAERHNLDAAMVYRYWGNRQRLIVDAALADVETWSAATDTGSLRGDLAALARNLTDRINTEVGRTYLRVGHGPSWASRRRDPNDVLAGAVHCCALGR